MRLQQLIYEETLKWLEEECLHIEKHNNDSYVPLRDLSRWIDESGKMDTTLKRFIKNCPEYGFQLTRSKWLIRIKYLPYLVSRFGIGRITDKKVRDKICEILGGIKTDDAANLESKIKEKFACLRADNFEDGSTVGKKEIYKLTSELCEFIKSKSTNAEQEM